MRQNVYDNVKIIGGVSLKAQQFSGNTEVDGASVDSLGADNAAIHAHGDAATGSPSAATLAVKVQESADGSTGWSDALDNTGAVIGFTLTCTSAAAENLARIEGLGLNRKRYLRAAITPAFSGGSSPKILGFAEIILGNTGTHPTNATASNT